MQPNGTQGARSLRRPLPISLRNAPLDPPVFTSAFSDENNNNNNGGGATSSPLVCHPPESSPSYKSMELPGSQTLSVHSQELKKKSLAELLAVKNKSPSSAVVEAAPPSFTSSFPQKTAGGVTGLTTLTSVSTPPVADSQIGRSSSPPPTANSVFQSHHVDASVRPSTNKPASNGVATRTFSINANSDHITRGAPKLDSTVVKADGPAFLPPSSASIHHTPSSSTVSEANATGNPPSSASLQKPAVVLSASPEDLLAKKPSAAEAASFSFAPRPSSSKKEVIGGRPASLSPLSPSRGTIFSSGIKGVVRHRLLKEMIDHVEDTYKIIVCDQVGAQILNSCFRMHELMEHDVVVVEDLLLARQPILNSPALYFLSPENPLGIEAMEADWSTRPRYKNLHVFWTSQAPDAVLERLSRNRLLAANIRSMVDMMLDFEASETLMFQLNTKLDFPALLSTSCSASQRDPSHVSSKAHTPCSAPLVQEVSYSEAQWDAIQRHDTVLKKLAYKLVSVFHAIGDGLPIIRYHSQSPTAQKFAELVATECKNFIGPALSPTAVHRPQLIIFDRCSDLLEPLAHHRSYQCLAGELCPFPNGVYEQSYQGRKGEELKRVMMIDEQDEHWGRFRHESFDLCLRVFQEHLKKLLEENPSLAHGMQKGVGVTAAGSAIRALPEFLERQSKLSAHVDICTTITQRYVKQQLQAVIDMELDIIYRRRPTKELLKEIKSIGGDLSISASLRVRLLALSFAFLPEKSFPVDERWKLISNCGLAEEMAPMMPILQVALQRSSRLWMSVIGKNMPVSMKDNSGASEEQTEGGKNRVGGGGANDASSTKGLLHHPTLAKFILEEMIKETLNPSEFPYVPDTVEDSQGGLNHLRDHLSLRKEKKQTVHYNAIRTSSSQTSGAKEEALLHLGYEGTYGLKAPEKIILFVLGGVTYGEGRVAYELAKEYGREVIVGGCHILQHADFLKEMRECGLVFFPSPHSGTPGSVEKNSVVNTSTNASMAPSASSMDCPSSFLIP